MISCHFEKARGYITVCYEIFNVLLCVPSSCFSILLYSSFLIKRYLTTLGFKLTTHSILRVEGIRRKKSKTVILMFPSGVKQVTQRVHGSLYFPFSRYEPLMLRKPDRRRSTTQTWSFREGKLTCGLHGLVVQVSRFWSPIAASSGWAFFETKSLLSYTWWLVQRENELQSNTYSIPF